MSCPSCFRFPFPFLPNWIEYSFPARTDPTAPRSVCPISVSTHGLKRPAQSISTDWVGFGLGETGCSFLKLWQCVGLWVRGLTAIPEESFLPSVAVTTQLWRLLLLTFMASPPYFCRCCLKVATEGGVRKTTYGFRSESCRICSEEGCRLRTQT